MSSFYPMCTCIFFYIDVDTICVASYAIGKYCLCNKASCPLSNTEYLSNFICSMTNDCARELWNNRQTYRYTDTHTAQTKYHNLHTELILSRRACAVTVRVYLLCESVCLCVCPFQNTLLRTKNGATYSSSHEDQKVCEIFSENALLQS